MSPPRSDPASAGSVAAAGGASGPAGPLPRRPPAGPPWLGRVLAGVATLSLLWLAFRMTVGGQPLVALGVLTFGLAAVYVYASATTLAWKYLFPGVAGPAILKFFHWLGAVVTNPMIIGRKWTPVRRVVDRAVSMVAVDKRAYCMVVAPDKQLLGLFAGTPEAA